MKIKFVENIFRYQKTFLILIMLTLMGVLIYKNYQKIQSIFEGRFGKKAEEQIGLGFEEEERVPIKVYQLKKTDFEDTMTFLGSISGYQEIDLSFEVAGMLESFNFIEGERIREGDIIANLVQADALLKLKYSEYEMIKNQKLYDYGGLLEFKYQQSKLEYESAKNDLDKTNLYATIDGLMGTIEVEEGENLTAGEKVGILIDTSEVFLNMGIIEKDIHRISIGQEVKVVLDAFPGRSFEGTIDTIVPIVEGKTRTMPVKVSLSNPDELLKPGMFARAWVSAFEKSDALIVPNSALKKKKDKYFVAKVHVEAAAGEGEGELSELDRKMESILRSEKEDEGPQIEEGALGYVENVPVQIEYLASDYAVIEKGLMESDIVIIDMADDLQNKTKIEIAEIIELAL